MRATRRSFIVAGSAAAVVATTGAKADVGPDNPLAYTAHIVAVEDGDAIVAPVDGGDQQRVPVAGYPDGIMPVPGDLVAIDRSTHEMAPVVGTIEVKEDDELVAGAVTRTAGGSFEVLDETTILDKDEGPYAEVDGLKAKLAWVTVSSQEDAVPRALSIAWRHHAGQSSKS